MVAIIAERAGGRARLLAGGLGGARRQPLAHDLARVAAHRAPGDRRRDRARDRARAGRGDHARDGLRRSRPFAANPLDGFTFLFEPVQPLAATIVQESGGQTIGPMAHTIYAIAAVLLVSAAMLSFAGLGRQAAAEALRDRRLMASVDARAGRPARGPERDAPPARRASPPGRCSTASCYWLCWATGIGAVLDRGGDRRCSCSIKGISYLRPSLLLESPAPSLQQSQAGGFLDPIERHVHRSRRSAIAIAAPIGVALATWLTRVRPSEPGSRARSSRRSR